MKRIIYMVFMNLFHAPVWLLKIARMARPGDNHTTFLMFALSLR